MSPAQFHVSIKNPSSHVVCFSKSKYFCKILHRPSESKTRDTRECKFFARVVNPELFIPVSGSRSGSRFGSYRFRHKWKNKKNDSQSIIKKKNQPTGKIFQVAIQFHVQLIELKQESHKSKLWLKPASRIYRLKTK